MPPDAQEITSLRIVVRPHVNQELTEILVRDIEGACEYLEQHGGNATAPKLHDEHKTSAKC
jgi:glutamate decarboxylase